MFNYETPNFEIIKEDKTFEIRLYENFYNEIMIRVEEK